MQNKQTANLQQFRMFVERNPELLEKLYQRCFTDNEFTHLSEVPRKELLQFTKELFGFNREPYTSKEMKQKIDISLMESFINYEQENPEEQLQLNNVIKMLEYCIENNKTFAVEYKPKAPKEDPIEDSNDQTQQHAEQPSQSHEQQAEEPPELNEQPKESSQRVKTKENTETEPAGSKVDQEATLSRRLGIVFDFYCKQQQNVGSNTTFDRISHECSVMTLGKFLIFCHGYGVTSEQLNKYVLMEKYKKIAEGRKEITIDKFVELIKVLRDIDPELTTRVNLDSDKTFKQKLKILNIPFSTKGGMKHEPTILHQPKLTSHSGKTSEQLAEYLEAKRLEKKSVDRHVSTPIPSPPLPKKYKDLSSRKASKSKEKGSYTQIASLLKDNNHADDSAAMKALGLDKLIIMEEADDEWLKEYRLHTSSNHSQMQDKGQSSYQVQREQAGPADRSSQIFKPMVSANTRAVNSSSKLMPEPPTTKNDSIVNGIRKRIAEISRSENARESLNMMKLNTMNNQQERKLSHLKNRL